MDARLEINACPPWDQADVFPERPIDSEYGYMAGRKFNPCARDELVHVCRNRSPPVQLVWTPNHPHLVPPFEIEVLRSFVLARRAKQLGTEIVVGAVNVVTWAIAIVLFPRGWPLFLILFVMMGLAPLVQALGAKRRLLARDDASPDATDLRAVSRFSAWVSLRRKPVTFLLSSCLVLVGSAQLIEMMLHGWFVFLEDPPSVEHAVQAAGLVKEHALGRETWRLFTGPFLHANILHWMFNFAALLTLATFVEVLAGGKMLGLVFLLSLACGSVASTLFLPSTPSVGASGGIMGLLGFLAVVTYRQRTILPIRLHRELGMSALLIGFAGVVGFRFIDNPAHIGGFLTGLLLALILWTDRTVEMPRQHSAFVRLLGMSACVFLVIVALLTTGILVFS